MHSLLGAKVVRSRAFWIGVACVVVLAGVAAAVVAFTDFEFKAITAAITDWIGRLHAATVVPLMALLPVAGFPIAVVYLVAGARFGPAWGGVVVAVVTAFHLLATHAVARSFLRAPIERLVERKHQKLPEIPPDEQPAVAVVAALVPGLPYFVRNYLLALSGVRLRVYFWTCLPIYVARSYVTILLGDLGSDPSRRGLFILVGVDVLKVVICGAVIWWLKRHHQRVHGHEHDGAHGGSAPPIAAARK